MIANVVKDLGLDSFNWPGAAAFALLALVVTLALLAGAEPRRVGPSAVMLRLAVLALVAFMTLPTLVVVAVSFNPTAILSFPPAGFSLRWYANALTYPQFQRAAVNSLVVTRRRRGARAADRHAGRTRARARAAPRRGPSGPPSCSRRSSVPASRPGSAS